MRVLAGWSRASSSRFHQPEVVGTGDSSYLAGAYRSQDGSRGVCLGGRCLVPGLPTTRSPIRNVWSENMAVRRSVFEEVGGFRAEFTKVGECRDPMTRPLREDGQGRSRRDLDLRPDAIVDHDVGPERARFPSSSAVATPKDVARSNWRAATTAGVISQMSRTTCAAPCRMVLRDTRSSCTHARLPGAQSCRSHRRRRGGGRLWRRNCLDAEEPTLRWAAWTAPFLWRRRKLISRKL